MQFEKELNAAIEAGLLAKKIVLSYYYSRNFKMEIKEDKSPVTDADKASDEAIRGYLAPIFPNYAFLTEESLDNKDRLNNDYCWIIDPVDGTKDFLAKDDMFTINIALAYKHEVVVGVVVIPAMNIIYYASKGDGAYVVRDGFTTKIHVSKKTKDLTMYRSVFHYAKEEAAEVEKHKDKITKVEKVGSSIKGCYIAEGKGEISYRFTDGTKEWDTAAFQCIVEEAGGLVIKLDKTPLTYNREDVYNHGGYIVLNTIENFLI